MAGIDLQRGGQLPEHRDAGRNARPLYRSDVSQAEPGKPRNVFLGQAALVPKSSEISRQNVLQVHAEEIME